MKNGKQIMEEYVRQTTSGSEPWQKPGVVWSEDPRLMATVEGGFAGTSDTVEVMLIHEDLQTGLRGKYILDNLESKLGQKTRFLVDLWRFDMLREPELQDQAVRDGKRAGIVIISLHGNLELPMAVREWFHCWIKSRNADSCALVVSLDARMQGTVAAEWTLDYLRRAAAPAGLDLFPHFAVAPGCSRDWTLQHSPAQIPVFQNADWCSHPDSEFRYFGGIND